jgi:hypothetical protein
MPRGWSRLGTLFEHADWFEAQFPNAPEFGLELISS